VYLKVSPENFYKGRTQRMIYEAVLSMRRFLLLEKELSFLAILLVVLVTVVFFIPHMRIAPESLGLSPESRTELVGHAAEGQCINLLDYTAFQGILTAPVVFCTVNDAVHRYQTSPVKIQPGGKINCQGNSLKGTTFSIEASDVSITNCLDVGSVTIQSADPGYSNIMISGNTFSGGITGYKTSGILIENNVFLGAASVNLLFPQHTRITNNQFLARGGNILINTGQDTSIENSVFNNPFENDQGSQGVSGGIGILQSTNTYIGKSNFSNTTTGVSIEKSTTTTVEDCTFQRVSKGVSILSSTNVFLKNISINESLFRGIEIAPSTDAPKPTNININDVTIVKKVQSHWTYLDLACNFCDLRVISGKGNHLQTIGGLRKVTGVLELESDKYWMTMMGKFINPQVVYKDYTFVNPAIFEAHYPIECGNEFIESGEECDLTTLGENNCLDRGFNSGEVSCYPPSHAKQCTINTDKCSQECIRLDFSKSRKEWGNPEISYLNVDTTGKLCPGDVFVEAKIIMNKPGTILDCNNNVLRGNWSPGSNKSAQQWGVLGGTLRNCILGGFSRAVTSSSLKNVTVENSSWGVLTEGDAWLFPGQHLTFDNVYACKNEYDLNLNQNYEISKTVQGTGNSFQKVLGLPTPNTLQWRYCDGANPPTTPPPTIRCGDSSCASSESCTWCPQDCGPCPLGDNETNTSLLCGDSICDSNEDCRTCQEDCCPQGPETCGNNRCDGDETCTNCPEDCSMFCRNNTTSPPINTTTYNTSRNNTNTTPTNSSNTSSAPPNNLPVQRSVTVQFTRGTLTFDATTALDAHSAITPFDAPPDSIFSFALNTTANLSLASTQDVDVYVKKATWEKISLQNTGVTHLGKSLPPGEYVLVPKKEPTTTPADTTPSEMEEPKGTFPWYLLIIFIVLIAGLLVFMFRNRILPPRTISQQQDVASNKVVTTLPIASSRPSSNNPRILKFEAKEMIKKQLSQGKSMDDIKLDMIKHGWNSTTVEEAAQDLKSNAS
jgi:hypothetical protein